jgi:hypothetical protein
VITGRRRAGKDLADFETDVPLPPGLDADGVTDNLTTDLVLRV